ncbi:hypothetical protein PYCC9005_003668 [Savitreella phatthalungensis]
MYTPGSAGGRSTAGRRVDRDGSSHSAGWYSTGRIGRTVKKHRPPLQTRLVSSNVSNLAIGLPATPVSWGKKSIRDETRFGAGFPVRLIQPDEYRYDVTHRVGDDEEQERLGQSWELYKENTYGRSHTGVKRTARQAFGFQDAFVDDSQAVFEGCGETLVDGSEGLLAHDELCGRTSPPSRQKSCATDCTGFTDDSFVTAVSFGGGVEVDDRSSVVFETPTRARHFDAVVREVPSSIACERYYDMPVTLVSPPSPTPVRSRSLAQLRLFADHEAEEAADELSPVAGVTETAAAAEARLRACGDTETNVDDSYSRWVGDSQAIYAFTQLVPPTQNTHAKRQSRDEACDDLDHTWLPPESSSWLYGYE